MTFTTPFLPGLNEFYRRNAYHRYSAARAERDGLRGGALGLITYVTSQQETIRAIPVRALLTELFRILNMQIEPSPPGLVCARLIEQLGGVQGCRVLKIRGARELIQKYNPDQSFTRSAADRTIGNVDEATGRPRFSEFENLYIEPREKSKLRAADVFRYLVSKQVFRVGLELTCPNCLLRSWVHIDHLKTISRCEYCGFDFDVSHQLRDRDWRYRRSGLFGRADEQHGSVPVAVTIQQLDAALDSRALMYSTALRIQPTQPGFESCEIDFLFLVAGYESLGETPVQLLLGECKTSKPIDEVDVRKLKALFDAIPVDVADAYIMFAKTDTFAAEGVALARTLNSACRRRVILWGRDELEPYFVYERARESLGSKIYGASLSEMASVTEDLFFSAP